MTNIEAIGNIAANLGEILGISIGGMLLTAAIVYSVTKYPGKVKQMFLFSFLSIVIALAIPGLVLALQGTNLIIAAIVGWLFCIPVIVVFFWVYFLPWSIASKRAKPSGKWIKVLNLLFLIPFSWIIALIWATLPDMPKKSDS